MITTRQAFVLRKVIEGHLATGEPVGSKWLSAQADVAWGPSTIRAELAQLESAGLLRHPHTSAGRVPTDGGYRAFVDELMAGGGAIATERPGQVIGFQLSDMRREVDEAMRVTTEQLSQATDLLALVSAPPLATTTIRRTEVLQLQPQIAMVVVITSTGGVSKRVISYERRLDPGLIDWASSYLNEALGGAGVGSNRIATRLADPALSNAERDFLATLAPAFLELEESAEDTLYVDGAARLLQEDRFPELIQIGDLIGALERRVALLSYLRGALGEQRVYLRIGHENPAPELHSLSLVAANYGTGRRNLGAVGVLGPTRMDYPHAISAVRAAAAELSRFVDELYE